MLDYKQAYTLTDLSHANEIMAEQQVIMGDGVYLIPREWIDWAREVIQYWTKAWKATRLFNAFLTDWQMSVKAFWQTIRHYGPRFNVVKLLRSLTAKLRKDRYTRYRNGRRNWAKPKARYQYRSLTERDSSQVAEGQLAGSKGRCNKHRFRIRNQQITDLVQVKWAGK